MIKESFENITKEHIERLLTDEIPESRSLEYKQELPDFSDKRQKRKFLAMISAFANTIGGDLLYGITELQENGHNTGKPEKATGVEIENPDGLISQIKDIIINNIEPRIVPQVVAKAISGFDLGPVIIIRIKRSATSPHAVWMDKKALFYVRSSNSTDLMDVDEIRMSFTMRESLLDRLKAFRKERIKNVLSGDTPVPLRDGAKLVLHILPVEAFDPLVRQNLVDQFSVNWRELMPIGCNGCNHRYNFKGLLIYCTEQSDGSSEAYCQCFEAGSIELVCANIAFQHEGTPYINKDFDQNLLLNAKKYLARLQQMQISCPVAFLFSFLSVRNHRLNYNLNFGYEEGAPIDHDDLLLPEIFVNSFTETPSNFLKPAIDTIWRACGYPRDMRNAHEL